MIDDDSSTRMRGSLDLFFFLERKVDESEDRLGIFGVSREKCIFNLIKGKFRFEIVYCY